MSLYNGDKGRDNRRRRARIKQRKKNRELRHSLEGGTAKPQKAKRLETASQKS